MTTHDAAQATSHAPAGQFVALTLQTTGIHPSTGRIVAIDALVCDPAAAEESATPQASAAPRIVEEFHAVVNPGPDTNLGPVHYHGLTPEDIHHGRRWTTLLKQLDKLLDGRELVVHDAAFTWGFIISEARRTMNAAARANRSRGRNRRDGARSGKGARRQRVGHIPTPTAIIDVLATARRAEIPLSDTRLAHLAAAAGVADVEPPTASLARAAQPEAATTRAATELLIATYLALAADGDHPLTRIDPQTLRADAVGLQRSDLRVSAAAAPRTTDNPGTWRPGTPLLPGMEVVIAPETAIDPDVLIAAAQDAGLAYSEKLSRATSLVVCNATTNLRGKAMHAARKGIPLLADAAFLTAARTAARTAAQAADSPTAAKPDAAPTPDEHPRSARGGKGEKGEKGDKGERRSQGGRGGRGGRGGQARRGGRGRRSGRGSRSGRGGAGRNQPASNTQTKPNPRTQE